MQANMNKTIVLLIYCLLIIAQPAFADWGPWSVSASEPVQKEKIETSLPKITAISSVRFYQNFISPLLRQDKCNFTPSCSRYSVQSIEQYGAFKGLVMTFERLSRDHPWTREGKYEKQGRKYQDLPSHNDYW
jgi:putative membrane protein insertion efficiency factor